MTQATFEITSLNLDLLPLTGGHSVDYNMPAAHDAYREAVEALTTAIVPSVSLHGAQVVRAICAYADRDVAREINWDGLADQVDGSAILAAHERPTVEVTADVNGGIITFDDSALDVEPVDENILAILTDPDTGGMVTQIDIAPWGEDEEDMDRADKGLADYGLRRVGPWSGSEGDQYRTARVTRGRGATRIKLRLIANTKQGWTFSPVGRYYACGDLISHVTAGRRLDDIKVEVRCDARCGWLREGGKLDHSDHTRTRTARQVGTAMEAQIQAAMNAAMKAAYVEGRGYVVS